MLLAIGSGEFEIYHFNFESKVNYVFEFLI